MTGVSATIFQKGTEYHLAVRGTELQAGDLIADAILAAGVSSKLNPQYLALKAQLDQWIGQGGPLNGQSFTVAGHSLGGYLAAAVKADYFQASAAYLYNAPGTGGLVGNIAELVSDLFSQSVPGANGIWNIKASEGISFITGLGGQPSGSIPIQIEAAAGLGLSNHSIVQLTDALAIQAIYATLDPTLNQENLNTLGGVSGNSNTQTLEFALDALRKLLIDTTETTTTNDRESLYSNLHALQNSEIYKSLIENSKIEIITDFTASAIATKSRQTDTEGIAWRYAIAELNPFSLIGADYSQHNTNGELDLYDVSADTGKITESWLQARAEMLIWKSLFDQRDTHYTDRLNILNGLFPTPVEGDHVYRDLTTELTLNIDGVNPATLASHYIVFGTPNGETLEGSGDSDRLYGMSGDDILIGGKGNDHMEGGEGFDTYRIAPEDGNDVILDTDGKGVIVYNGLTLGDGQSIAPNQWQNALGHTYTLIETGMTRDLLIHAGSEQILVKNHQDGNLGIRLLGDEAPESFSQSAGGITVVGDRRPYQMSWDYWLWVNNPTWPYLFDVNGNMVRTDVPQPFYADKIFDTAGDDNIYAGDGLNVIYAYNGGNNQVQTGANSDYILGGAGRERIFSGGMTDTIDAGGGDDIVYGEGGRDVIEGGAGNDFLSGGEGADAIHGGEGDDRIYGREAMTWDQALTDSGIASQEQGELLAGGAGNDVVVGDAGNDALLGGEGDDMISGREGDDIILGDSTLTFVVPPLSVFDSIIGATRWPMGPYLDFHSPFSTAPMLGIHFERIDHGPDSVDRYESRLSSLENPEATVENWIVPATAGGNDQLHGGTGDDWLFGEFGNDILDGGAGNDYLNGGTGDDIYLFGHGSVQDTVFDHDEAPGNVDTILMADGVVASDVEVSRDRFNLYLSLGGAVDGLTLSHWFRADAYKIERVVFADGVTWNAADLQSMAGGLPVAGSDADDSLDGSDDNDEIRGFAGSDTLSGGMGDDRLEGGRDADTLAGGDGTDTYHFNPGDGMDEVRDSLSGGANVLSFSEGIAREHLRLEEDAAGLLLHYGDGDTIRLPGAGRSDPVFGQVLLADGTTFDFVELFANRAPSVGTPLPTSLVADEDAPFSFIPPGDAFNDPDGDSLTFDATLADGSPLPDWLTFDAATGTLSGTPDNGDVGQLLLRFGATDTEGESAFQEMTLTVLNVNDAPLATHSLPDQQAQGGKTWSYTLPEGSFADEDAGDVLNYRANLADGSDLPDWLTFDTGTRTLSGTSPLGTDGSLTVRITAADRAGAQAQSTFALAVNPGLPRVQGNEGVDILAAGSSGTLLQGLGGNDILLGRSGNDILDGGRGNDLLTGGSGSDTYRFGRGDGHDRIVELDLRDKDTDRLVFGEDIAADQLWFQRKGLDLDIGVIGTADHATVTGWYLSSRLRVDERYQQRRRTAGQPGASAGGCNGGLRTAKAGGKHPARKLPGGARPGHRRQLAMIVGEHAQLMHRAPGWPTAGRPPGPAG